MKFGFVSCLKIQNIPNQDVVWNFFKDQQIDMLLILGDSFYTNNLFYLNKHFRNRIDAQWGNGMPNSLKQLLEQINNNIHVTWDDHDFGPNNSKGMEGRMKKNKTNSKEVFYEFFPQMKQNAEGGIQYSQNIENEKIKVISLDIPDFSDSS